MNKSVLVFYEGRDYYITKYNFLLLGRGEERVDFFIKVYLIIRRV
jgi:hypothetical protein